MDKPTNEQIMNDNPHFGDEIRIVYPIETYSSKRFDFTHSITVGAINSQHKGDDRTFDAWATYLWSPDKNAWCLGAN